jgi:radical SAM protein with 4Fe4S-binding SPASM domain
MTGDELQVPYCPRNCVWELTLACNCNCTHCGSNAGHVRPGELDLKEALALVAELAELGCECVTLSGGEPLMRGDWPKLASAIRSRGMQVELITNGLLVVEQADAIRDAGFSSVTFSVDGPRDVHDRLRGVPGSLEAIWAGAQALRSRNVMIGAVTQINRLNREYLSDIRDLLLLHDFGGWQLQLTMPHGRARKDTEHLCLRADELIGLEKEIIELRSTTSLLMQVGDNIGYMSRDEPRLRSHPGHLSQFWTGCTAGLSVVGIASDGTVRGCLSLPQSFNEGNLRERSLKEIWHDPHAFAYNREFHENQLKGNCSGCAFGRICRGGCRSLAAAVSPLEPFGNPYCTFALSR